MKKKQNQSSSKAKTRISQSTVKNYYNILWIAGIVIFTIFIYHKVFDNQLTNFDDVVYISDNPYIQEINADNVKSIFSEFYYGGYYPLTLISFAFDIAISPGNPSIFIITNFILHLINTILLFYIVIFIFKNTTLSIVTALLFGVHTLHVESVAWVSERKDVLYTMFYFLAILTYLKYLSKPKTSLYLLTLLLFIFSVLSKTMGVAFVAVLFLIDWFYGKKLFDKKNVLEKVPFLIIGVIFGIVAILSQKSIGAIDSTSTLPLLYRVVFAAFGFCMYLLKLIYPFQLSAFYPYPVEVSQSIPIYYFLFILPFIGFIAGLIYLFRKNKEHAFALSFFFLNIILVLQILQINDFMMADRFVYVASAGIYLSLALIYNYFHQKFVLNRRTINIVLSVYIGILGYQTSQRVEIWQNSITLWDDVISKYPSVYKAWDKRGLAKADDLLDFKSAISDYDSALKINPDYYSSYINRGYAKFALGDNQGAIDDYNKAISLKPDYYSAFNNRGSTLANMGKLNEALDDFSKAIELNPENGKAYCNRGLVYMNMNQIEKSLNEFNKCLEISPTYFPAYNYRAMIYARQNKIKEALNDLDFCLQLQPNFSEALYNRGVLHLQTNKRKSACEDLQKAASLGYDRAYNLINSYCN